MDLWPFGLRRRGAFLAAAVAAFTFLSPATVHGQDNSPAQSYRAAADISDLVQDRLPAVVNISTTQKVPRKLRSEMPPEMEEFLRRFGTPFGAPSERPDRGPGRASALGSGFIIDRDGYVVTNNHVIAEADEIKVILQDGVELPAKLVGRDPRSDIALLKVESSKRLTALTWGDSDRVRVGEAVFAIGNPFGLGGTVTSGIISARARDINAGPYDDFLQTDAAINRGNSGGPLFNMRGEVIGVNTAIFSPTGGNVGIGFAVPAAVAQRVVAELRDHGIVNRGWLGVTIQRLTDEIAQAMGMNENKGALVSGVTEGSPAAKAGIKTGDVIIGYDGKDVGDTRALTRMVAGTPPGQRVDVIVLRNGKQRELTAAIAALKDTELSDAGEKGAESAERPSLGLVLAPLTPAARARLDLDKQATGVVVVEVERGSVAAQRGIRPGDLIKRIGDQEVKTPEEVKSAIGKAKAANQSAVLALVEREGQSLFVPVPLKGPQG